MADNRQKWHDATREILLALDLPAEYRLLGVDVCGQRPSAKGWIECRAYGMDDRSPSAGICVQDGPSLGRYKSFRDGKSESLFDFAARVGKCGGDWKECRNFYARQTGVKLPEGSEEVPADRFEFYDATFGGMLVYAEGKPGVTVEALQDVGVRAARWPKALSPEMTNHLYAVPMYDGSLDREPTGWHCFAQNPRLKIRKYQGKGREESLLKVLSVGSYGFMNVDGLHRLAQAEVVWLVEGISDLLATQALLRVWREADPATRRHVVLTVGGCGNKCRPEWTELFQGKDVRVCYDVGDKDDEGQNGARHWVSSLLPVAKSVRNVVLPPAEGGKNDLRDWLVSGKRSYEDLLAFSETFPPAEPEADDDRMTAEALLLANLGITVLGRNLDRSVEVYCSGTNQHTTIKSVARLQPEDLVLLVGSETFRQHVHTGREAPQGMATMSDVRMAIADAGSKRAHRGNRQKIGTGLWLQEQTALLVTWGKIGKLRLGETKIETTSDPFQGDVFCDISEAHNWLDFRQLERYLLQARDRTWRQNQFEELERLIRKWHWVHPKTPQVVTALAVSSMLQTFWTWRPQVFLTGGSEAGKSSLIELLKHLFGEQACFNLKPTEAGIRQQMKHHLQIPLIDEFEDDHNKQRVLSMFRITGHGGNVFRGTTDQVGRTYHLRHMPWFSAIEVGLNDQADANRFLVFELKDIPREAREVFSLPDPPLLRDVGVRLLACGLAVFSQAQSLAKRLKAISVSGLPGRTLDCLSVPFGMYGAIYDLPVEGAEMILQKYIESSDWGTQQTRDDTQLVEAILGAEVQTGPGAKYTVAQILFSENTSEQEALARVGIIKKNLYEFWIYPKGIQSNLLKNGKQIGRTIARIKGVEREQYKIGNTWFWGYSVPSSVFRKLDQREENEETVSEREF